MGNDLGILLSTEDALATATAQPSAELSRWPRDMHVLLPKGVYLAATKTAAASRASASGGRVSSGHPVLTSASVALRMAAAGLDPDEMGDDPDPDCPQYTAISDTHLDNEYCKNNCNYGYCPSAMCKCDEALLAAKKTEDAKVAKETKAAGAGAGAGGKGKEAAEVDEGYALHPKGYIPSKVAGPWFYVADGLDWEANNELTKPRSPAYKFLDAKNTSRRLPGWMADSKLSGNSVVLAFMNPKDLESPGWGVPPAFADYTAKLRSKEPNRQVVWSIGGAAYPDFPFMSDAARAEKAGVSTCAMAKKFEVGIELDQEGGDGKVDMIKRFVVGFRKNCPMGKYQISMDLTGGPSVTNDVWMSDVPKALVPAEGAPHDPPPKGDWLDFVNLMVIDACNAADCNFMFWQAWEDAGLNMRRAVLSFAAGGAARPEPLCSQADGKTFREAWEWGQKHRMYGLRAWAVSPSLIGDWSTECDDAAPGMQQMAAVVLGESDA